jgi:plastocyanin
VGDTVNFMLSSTDMAPHTVTFLNGNPDISFVTVVPNPPNPPLLLLNPQVVFPINPGLPLTRTGVFSSGLLVPGQFTSYSWKIGNISGSISYQCLLHDTSGMVGSLYVTP